MSRTLDRLRAVRETLTSRRRDRRAARGERELRRASVRAQRHEHATFDEGRREPGGTGGI
jgi:hypothetical protein